MYSLSITGNEEGARRALQEESGTFPLSLSLSFLQEKTTLRFQYLTDLHLITCTGVEAKMFINLNPDDTGILQE